ncbi:MAG: hypothetical protein ACTSRP_15460, partial [Candidatus Helarchaeota archaeon]
KRTEQRLNELAEAQKRTEQRLNELAEAQKRTEQRLNELAEAQKRTEDSLNNLAKTVKNLSISVGKLGDIIGYGLEDIARLMLPTWLNKHENIEIEELTPTFIQIEDKEFEINLAGFGKRNGEDVLVIGECKSRIYSNDVKKFSQIIEKVKEKYPDKEIIPFLFGYLLHPQAQIDAKINNIRLIATYSR